MDKRRQEALDYHSEGRPGKIEVVPTKSVATARDLSLAYSPGVAEPCLEIHKNPLDVFKYTARGNLVAVVSNGTAVLGLGNIGPLAAKPVMEGKGVLFKSFAGIDVFDLEVASEKAEDVIRFCELLEPTVGGINLEDISAPECFVIERTLKERLDIPVFHDDQHGTAIIAGAALINALEVTGKKIDEVKVLFSGAGASALSTAEHFGRLGVPLNNILIVDSKGVLYEGRTEGMNEYKEPFAVKTDRRTLADAFVDADVFVGLSVKGLVTPEMVKSMAANPIIFALANPDPEILPEEVAAIRDDAIMATGRSDYPNQVNNVLGFPFIFRGALDVRARSINSEMMMAATHALAELAREEVPDTVRGAYEGSEISFGRDYLIPKPFDHRVLFHVSPAVAKAAMDSGVARETVDLDEYRDRLRASLGPGREVMRWMTARARRKLARVAFPEGHNDIVIRAASQMVEDGICRPVLLGRPSRIAEKAKKLGVPLDGVEIIYGAEMEAKREEFADILFERRGRRGLTLSEAQWNLFKPIYFAASMLEHGEVDALVSGIEANYAEVLRPCLQVIGPKSGGNGRVAGLYMLAFPNRELLFFSDTTVNIEPDARALAEIAVQTAEFVRELGITPRIAMVTFSNFGSAIHDESRRVASAVEMVRTMDPELEIDGEMQADTAVDAVKLANIYPFSRLKGPANVLVFSRLSAANASYKLLHMLGGADLIGPVLLGMAKPVHILQRGCGLQDVLNLATVASVDWQARSEHI
ncbi:MAG: NADP-dependent malic enzyme [Gemmatimonadetes bacterium]|nr:NADP-dependent malic enzyme [Gemmatimonadota bacterium]MDA1102582.1 NADP-dependent malic enzyme [Gemmatimonadota bacterium]